MQSKYDIFISYARADEQLAANLQVQLERRGFRCWRDRENISPNEYFFPEKLARAIEDCQVAIGLLSEAYLSSYYCLQEFTNCLIDQPLSKSKIRFYCHSDNLLHHPIITASGNKTLHQDDFLDKDGLTWVKNFKKTIPQQGEISDLTKKLLAHLSNLDKSTEYQKYNNFVLKPFFETELISIDLQKKNLTGILNRIHNLINLTKNNSNTPDYIHSAMRSRLAFANYILGNYEEAYFIRHAEYKKSIELRGRFDFGAMQDAVMTIQCLNRMGRIDEAESFALDNISTSETHFGKVHELTISFQSCLVGIYCDTGQYHKALPYAKAAYEAKYQSLDPSSDEWRRIVMNYAFILMRTGDPNNALPLISKVFNAYKNDNGINNIDTAQAEIKLAECHLLLQRHRTADSHSQSALRSFSQLKPEHPLRATAAVVALQCAYANANNKYLLNIFIEHINPLISIGGDLAKQATEFLSENPEYNERYNSLRLIDDMMVNWSILTTKGFYIVNSEDSSTHSCSVCIQLDAETTVCKKHNININLESWSCPQFKFTGESRIEGDVPKTAWESLRPTIGIAIDGANSGDPDCQFIIGVFCAHRYLHQIVRNEVAKLHGITPLDVYKTHSKEINSNHWYILASQSPHQNSNGAKLARKMLSAETNRKDINHNVAIFWKFAWDFLQKSDYYENL